MCCDVLVIETETIMQKAIPRWEEEEADEGRGCLKAEPGMSGRGEARTLCGADFFISRTWSLARAFHWPQLWELISFIPPPSFSSPPPLSLNLKRKHAMLFSPHYNALLSIRKMICRSIKSLFILDNHRVTLHLAIFAAPLNKAPRLCDFVLCHRWL